MAGKLAAAIVYCLLWPVHSVDTDFTVLWHIPDRNECSSLVGHIWPRLRTLALSKYELLLLLLLLVHQSAVEKSDIINTKSWIETEHLKQWKVPTAATASTSHTVFFFLLKLTFFALLPFPVNSAVTSFPALVSSSTNQDSTYCYGWNSFLQSLCKQTYTNGQNYHHKTSIL